MAPREQAADWQRSIVVLTRTVVAAVVIGWLYWAQVVLVPVALALFLTLILGPMVVSLQRRGLRRVPAVIVVMLLTSFLVIGMGWIVTSQIVQLVGHLPNYSENIKDKIRSVKELTAGSSTGRFGRFIEEISQELGVSPKQDPAAATIAGTSPQSPEPAPVVVESDSSPWLGQATTALSSLAESLGTAALSLVLVVFMLLKRESLRDRMILLIGRGHMTAATKAFDEALYRIGRYLLMQLIVNGTYGIALAAGLFLLGVDYALVWGFLAAVLRYIPYVGAWVAAIFPVLLSFVMFEGWQQPLLVIGWIVIIELISNNIIEPWLYGHSIGVSEVAMLIAAAFWAFMWGPIGLVLSSPLTVCLVVAGKYVPQLRFFDTLLGDQPALEPHESFYQRLLARDQDEAAQIARTKASESSLETVFDTLILPALCYTKRDRLHDELSDQDEEFIVHAVHEIIDELGQSAAQAQPNEVAVDLATDNNRVPLLLCPAHDETEQLAVEMLGRIVDPRSWEVRIAGMDALASELVDWMSEQKVPLVLIGSLPPGGVAQTRYLCKRMRSYMGEVKIVVGRLGARGDHEMVKQQFLDAGADEVTWSLAETNQRLAAWRTILTHEPNTAAETTLESTARLAKRASAR